MNQSPIVILVDDEQANLDAYSEELRALNPSWKIICALSEAQLLDQMMKIEQNGETVDLVILDLVMEYEEHGLELLEKVRTKNPLVMTILFTAKDSSVDRLKAFERGAFDVLEKRHLRGAAISELNIKARAAISMKERAVRVLSLQKYFDPTLIVALEKEPDRLKLESKLVTVVFWDIRGFSKFTEILAEHPLMVSDFLQGYFEAAAQVIYKHGGVLDKFIGDGVMALFGALGTNQDDGVGPARAAVAAAIDLRKAFQRQEAASRSRWIRAVPQLVTISLGCGINTGTALVGRVGTTLRDQFTAFGRVVNLAARIEAHSKDYEILLSQPTAVRVQESCSIEDAGVIDNIKNIPGVYLLFRVR